MTLCDRETSGKILCIRLSALGDVVHCLNALTLLRRHRPAAHITWLVENRVAGLLEGHPYIDELISIPRLDWGQAIKDPWRWFEVGPEVVELISGLHREKFDISIDFQSSLKSCWLTAAAGAEVRIGFSTPVSREMNHLFQNRLVKPASRHYHHTERYMALLAPLSVPTEYAPPLLPCALEHKRVALNICRGLGRPIVVIHPGASDFARFKRWIPERYGELALKLTEEAGASVLVTFGPGEEALAYRVIAASKHRAKLSPRLTHLQQLTGLIKLADLFIGGDTGPMHIASAAGTPVVALFGPKNPVSTGPTGCPSEVITADVSCRPCNRRECPDPVCMERIGVNQVYEAALRMLSDAKKSTKKPDMRRKSFYCEFELGKWSGKVHTAFSEPQFYRFLAMIGIEGHPGGIPAAHDKEKQGGGTMQTSFSTGPGRRARPIYMRWNHSGKKRWKLPSFRSRRGILNRYYRNALKLCEHDIACIMPLCWMQQSGLSTTSEILLFEGARKPETAFTGARSNTLQPEFLSEIALLMQNLHGLGFHHMGPRISDFTTADRKKTVLQPLEELRLMYMPPLLREVCWALQLRRLYRDIKCFLPPHEFVRQFLNPYCKGHLNRKRQRRLLARTVHTELDIPELL